MSGIAAVYRRDGAAVEPQLLEALAQHLAIRGPDSHECWASGSFGLVHTHLATERGSRSNQLFSLDGQIWVTADARIDARQELVGKLGLARDVSASCSDAELIWRAYQLWGEDCAEHLLGDFAFLIADTRAQRLICARDQLGVKPLFYAKGDGWIIVSNLLECVRHYPAVDSRLDESFVLDFLMHGWNTGMTATVYRGIRRLAPAHVMRCTANAVQQRRYWELTIPEEDQTTRTREHVERFSELFHAAVSDRLRNQPAAVSFSGGKDSTTAAAAARKILADHPVQPALHGVCAVFDRILPDQERRYATLAAQKLGMPLEFLVRDDLPVFARDWDTPTGQTPEPSFRVISELRRIAEIASNRSRIVLCGFGGDEAIGAPARYYQKLAAEGRWLRWAADCGRHLWTLRSLPPVGLRTLLYKRAWARLTSARTETPTFPTWIHPDMVRAHSLLDRWEDFWHGNASRSNSRKPGGYAALSTYLVTHSLSDHDASALSSGIEFRFPYLDLRVIQHLWSIPPIPLRFQKQILLRAFDGRLPQEVLRRRKQGLVGDPLLLQTIRVPVTWEECLVRTPELGHFVTTQPAPGGDFSNLNSYDTQAALAPFELESWMHHRWRRGH